MPSFTYQGRRIGYVEYGSSPRAIVLVHGLLMDGRMYSKLAPTLAARGHRVVMIDLLGHGASAQPHDMSAYSMSQFGRDVIALLDHLESGPPRSRASGVSRRGLAAATGGCVIRWPTPAPPARSDPAAASILRSRRVPAEAGGKRFADPFSDWPTRMA